MSSTASSLQPAWVTRQLAAVAFAGLELFAIGSACASSPERAESSGSSAASGSASGSASSATATLESKSGSSVGGTVTFRARGEGVHVVADVRGLTPGSHGFHVHEVGDCSAPDASSAGEHFAGSGVVGGHQLGATHGLPDAAARHAGDLGNLEAGADGTARLEHDDAVLTLSGDRSVIGRAVIVHTSHDDGADPKSAGGRVACGVIVSASSK